MSENEILKDLFFIERGYLNANHLVYRSEAPILIDTGYAADFAETQRAIENLGVRIPDVALIINTHTHCDHIGGNRPIQQASGCEIALHTVGKHFIDTRDDWSTWWRYYHQKADFFNCTKALQDGDRIMVGPHEFEIIHTPGHAADGIVLYNRREKILISSDTLWEHDMAVMTLRVEGSAALFQMQESLRKIASLEVRQVYPGHGNPFGNPSQAIRKSSARIERYLKDRRHIGNDLIKKIIVYTLLMKKAVKQDDLLPYLMETNWYPETVDLYFDKTYEAKFDEILGALMEKGVIRLENGSLMTTVKP